MSNILEKSARKMFILDLSVAKSEKQSLGNAICNTWYTRCGSLNVQFSVVTIQGIVLKVFENDDFVLVDDGTAVAVVKGCNKLPFKTTKLMKGCYVMVVAQMLNAGRYPVLRVIKIQNLSQDVSLSAVWPLEVIDGLMQNREFS